MTDQTTFDKDAFLSTQTDLAGSTVTIPVPEDTYTSIIEGVDIRGYTNSKTGEPGLILEVIHNLQDASDAVKEKLGRDPITSRQSIFLDLNSAGDIDFGEGKNVPLGKLRDAVGQNTPGQPWSPSMLEGAGPLLVTVIHRPPADDGTVYDQVRRTAPLNG